MSLRFFILPASICFCLIFAGLSVGASAQSAKAVPVYAWTTLAGRASVGVEDGPAADARFNRPHGLAMDLAGNLFVADTGNHTIRKISPTGIVSTLAGSTGFSGTKDGAGAAAQFNGPQGIAADLDGNVYVADTGNHTIRKITPAGVVTTLAGQAGKKGIANGDGSSALFDSPDHLTVDTHGNVYLYNNGVRKISGGKVQTLQVPTQAVGWNGQIVTVSIAPECPAVDAAGQFYFLSAVPVPQQFSSTFRFLKLDAAGTLTAFLPEGFSLTRFKIFNDVAGNLFVTGGYTDYSPPGSQSYSGSPILPDGTGVPDRGQSFTSANGAWTEPLGLAVDQAGHWYYTRSSDDAIVGKAGTPLEPSGRDGTGQAARFYRGSPILDVAGNVWVMENPSHYSYATEGGIRDGVSLRKVSPAGVATNVFSRSGGDYWSFDPSGLASDGAGNVYISEYGHQGLEYPLDQISPAGIITSLGQMPSIYGALKSASYGLVSDPAGKLLTTTDHQILQRLSDGTWKVFAGGESGEIKDGTGESARFGLLRGLTADRHGDFFANDYLRDSLGNISAEFYLRKISASGTVVTLGKNLVRGIEDSRGVFYRTHDDLNTIVLVNAEGEEVTIGGLSGVEGSADGNGDQARFASPGLFGVDAQDDLYVVDGFGTTIRKGHYVGIGPTITIQPQSIVTTAGVAAQFTVAATGSPTPTFQWFFGSTAIKDATGTQLSLSDLRSSDAGNYSVVITNSLGSVTSAKASLTVGPVPAPTPVPTTSGGNGGGAISTWFVLALLALGTGRLAPGAEPNCPRGRHRSIQSSAPRSAQPFGPGGGAIFCSAVRTETGGRRC